MFFGAICSVYRPTLNISIIAKHSCHYHDYANRLLLLLLTNTVINGMFRIFVWLFVCYYYISLDLSHALKSASFAMVSIYFY